MKYTPDYKFREALELINNLDDTKENGLIKYYIKKKEEHIENQNKKLKEYNDFFETLNKLLPNTNTIFK